MFFMLNTVSCAILVLISFDLVIFGYQSAVSIVGGSPPNGSANRSLALPAAASWYQVQSTNAFCSLSFPRWGF